MTPEQEWADRRDLAKFAPSDPRPGEQVHQLNGISYTDTDLARELRRSGCRLTSR